MKQSMGHACTMQIHSACRYSLDSKLALSVEPFNLCWVQVVGDSAGGCWPGLGAVCELLTHIIRICRHCLGTTKSFLKCAKDSICSLSLLGILWL